MKHRATERKLRADAPRALRWQKAKYKAHEFGACPRTLCDKQVVLPVGLSDTHSTSNDNPLKLFCPRCQVRSALYCQCIDTPVHLTMRLSASSLAKELYDHNVPGGNYIDGAFFGTTYAHLFLQTFSELRPPPVSQRYVPRVFGFKIHTVEEQAITPVAREEWPKRPKGEPVSDWDS
jgi:casein kinase II subunit beta